MADLRGQIDILVSVARVDSGLNECRKEIARLPDEIARIDAQIEKLTGTEKAAADTIEDLAKERRTLEQNVEDQQTQIRKYKTQLMEVKTNREYTAMLHEIEHLEKEIDSKEERLLILMDEAEEKGGENKELFSMTSKEKSNLSAHKNQLEARLAELNEQRGKIEAERPKLLTEFDPHLKKRYDRIFAKFGDMAVTNMVHEICQGCFRRVPPQRSVEVRQNDQIISCEGCGRILVHYDA
ncbi:MAG: C4-type zinc ribbon domain-containing protein [bacterium]|nr:C4-type zinc ribbon domain-containing protein [bacterium]